MKRVIYFSFALFLFACSEDPKQTAEDKTKELLQDFKKYEDSLGVMQVNSKVTNSTIAVQYAEKCISVAEEIPQSEEAPKLLDKAHMIFCNFNMHRRSLEPAQKVIEKYPYYKNRLMVIQSVANAYDMFILPREKNQAKKYYELYLKENKNISKEEKADLEFRIKNIDLTVDQLIEVQNK